MNFREKKCIPCESGTPPLTPAQIEVLRPQISSDWQIIESKQLRKLYRFKDFVAAMKFVNAVADIAEQEGHHPDFHIFYNQVTLELWTHAVGGLSENDFIVAAKIDALPIVP